MPLARERWHRKLAIHWNSRLTVFSLFSWVAPLCLNTPGALASCCCTDEKCVLKERSGEKFGNETWHVRQTGKTRCGSTRVRLTRTKNSANFICNCWRWITPEQFSFQEINELKVVTFLADKSCAVWGFYGKTAASNNWKKRHRLQLTELKWRSWIQSTSSWLIFRSRSSVDKLSVPDVSVWCHN